MKMRIIIVTVLLIVLPSCKGPYTTVTDVVHTNGSIVRNVEVKHNKPMVRPESNSIPVDSTWSFHDSIAVSSRGDTTWHYFWQKTFKNAEAVNETYVSDSTSNRNVKRRASFKRSFKWFTTTYYFGEQCGRSLESGYPAEEYLTADELTFLRLPDEVKENLASGSDSLKWRSTADTINKKVEEWQLRSLIAEWITQAGILCSPKENDTLNEDILRDNEDRFLSFLDSDLDFPECLRQILGERIYDRYSIELDSARVIADINFDKSLTFRDYTLQIVMPGRLLSTNGYTYPDGRIAWDVSGEFFLTSEYLMYAKSEYVNKWAIAVTIILLGGIAVMTYSALRRSAGKKQ